MALSSKISPPLFKSLPTGLHLGPFSEASDPPEGQEQGGRGVEGQGRLQGVEL